MMTKASLNGICPYFTMFPLDFPNNILERKAMRGEWVMNPFCGRGTTNYASRMLGLPSIGIDSRPVAVALSQAKLANTTPEAIIATAREILGEVETPQYVPEGEFWEWACDANVLYTLCRLRGYLRIVRISLLLKPSEQLCDATSRNRWRLYTVLQPMPVRFDPF